MTKDNRTETALEALEKLKSAALFDETEFGHIRPFEEAYQTVRAALQSTAAKDAEIEDIKKELSVSDRARELQRKEIQRLKKREAELVECLQEAINGLKWYEAEHPEDQSDVDDEFMLRAEQLIARRTQDEAQPPKATEDGV